MSIEEIRGRLEAATPGPWSWTPNAFGNPSNGPDHHVIRSEDTRDQRAQFPVAQTDYDEMGSHDAEFIAHAPEDTRRLLNAVEAVLGLHKVERRWMTHEGADESYDSEAEAREWMDGDEPEGELPFFEVCAECKRVEEGPCDGECTRELGYRESMWPCPTVKAVTSALDPS